MKEDPKLLARSDSAKLEAASAMLATLKGALADLCITRKREAEMVAAIAAAEAAGIEPDRQSSYGHDSDGTRIKA